VQLAVHLLESHFSLLFSFSQLGKVKTQGRKLQTELRKHLGYSEPDILAMDTEPWTPAYPHLTKPDQIPSK
jgi:hypothetical protein